MAVVIFQTAVVGAFYMYASADTQEHVLQERLSAMRHAIAIYRLQHAGRCPALREGELPQLTNRTNTQGEIGARATMFPHGPYLAAELPANPVDGKNKVSAVARDGETPCAPAVAVGGWQYDETTGAIWPNHFGYSLPR